MINCSKEIGKVVTIALSLIMMAPVGLTFTGGEIILADLPPMVTVITPGSEEQIYNGTILIDWLATDAEDSDPTLDITIQYSLNGGIIWFEIMSGVSNNNPPYAWDTVAAGVTDGISYIFKITAIDNAGQYGTNTSYIFSIDNTPNDRWYLQVESVNLGTHLDLDMKPSESTIQEITIEVPSSGDVQVQSFASEYVAQREMDMAGDWTFSIFAKVCSSTANGSLYANVYADDGFISRLLFTTIYDDEVLRNHYTYHEFSWTHSVPSGTLIQNGEHVVMEIMLNATTDFGPPTTYYHYANADIPVLGTVIGNYNNTFSSDNQREVIDEVIGSNGSMVTILYEDFTGYFNNFPPGWTVIDGGQGGGKAPTWTLKNPRNRPSALPISEPFAIVDVHTPGLHPSQIMDEQLIIPILNLTYATSVTVEFDQYYHTWLNAGDTTSVDVRSTLTGGSWQNVLFQTGQGSPNPDHQVISITPWAAGASDVEIRFYYSNTTDDGYWWMVDNVHVKASLVNVSLLKHKWTFDIPPNEEPYQFTIEAQRPVTPDDDNFTFAYSTDDVHFTDMVTIDSQVESNLIYDLPPNLMGTVYIRVVDSDRTSNMGVISSIEIDRMLISSVAGSGPNLHNNYANAEIYIWGYVHKNYGDYTKTFVSDDDRQKIQQIPGPEDVIVPIIDEDFYAGIPSWWNVVNGGGGGGPASKWTTANPGNRDIQPPFIAPFAIVDALEHGNNMDEQLITPVIEMDDATSVILEFDQFLNHSGNSEFASVDVRSSRTGGSWQNVLYQNQTTPNPEHQIINITIWAAGAIDVEIRFHYYAPVSGYWWMVDNILLLAQASNYILEHKWTIDVPPDEEPYIFSFEGKLDNGIDDDFIIAYSIDDINYTNMFKIDLKIDRTKTYPLPPNLSGIIYIRVVDINRFSYNGPNQIATDQMFISSVSTPKLIIGFDNYLTPSYVEPMISHGPITHLCIQDAPGGIGNNVTSHTMTTDETYTVWAIGYDSEWNYVSDISTDWTNTLNAQTATSSTVFTLDPTTPGSGTITAVYNATLSDTTGLIIVTVGLLDNIVIRDSPGGLGGIVGSYSMTIDDTLTVWAAGYDADGNFIDDISCDWSTNGTLDFQTDISVNNFTFDPSTAGTSGYIIAVNGAFGDSAGLITVGAGGLDHIVIRYAPGGVDSEVVDVLMVLGQTLTVYCAGYDSVNNYIGDIPCNWTTTGTLNLTTATTSSSFTFEPAMAGETGTILSMFNGTIFDETGIITVIGSGIDFIIIEDGLGNEITTHMMDTTETFTVWAIGHNITVGEVCPVYADWTTTGTLDLQTATASQSFTFDPINSPTSGTIEGTYGALWDTTGTITVNPGPLTHLCIQDAPGGAGTNVTTHIMTVNDTFTVWATGYDAEWNYISDIPANWTNTLNNQTSTSSTVFTLDPAAPGLGTITAVFNATLSDTTGLITVTTGLLDTVIIRDAPGGLGNEVGAHSMATDDTLTVWAAGYDFLGYYIGDVDSNWTTNGTLDFQSAVMVNSFTFDPSTTGTSGYILAINSSVSDSAGLITVDIGGLDHIIIRHEAGGAGSEVTDVTMFLWDTLMVYSAGYDADNNYIIDIPCNWTTTGALNLTTATSSSSFTFKPAVAGETGTFIATFNSTISDETGTITVSDIGIDLIVIVDDLGQPVNNYWMDTSETLRVWAMGWNISEGAIGPVDADWTTTGSLDLQTATASQSFTFDPVHAPTSGSIEALYGTLWDSTLTVFVDPGPLANLCIQDSPGGSGSNVTTHTMNPGETFTVWVIGYDAEWNYIGNINCDWATTGTLDLQTATGVNTFTFSPMNPGTGTIIADYNATIGDETGLITVIDPIQYFDIDITPAAGSNGWILISFPNLIEGDPLTLIVDAVDEGAGLVTWDIVQWYDPTSPSGSEWKTTATFKPPPLNTFNYVNNTYSFWIHITNYGDGNLTIQGDLATTGEWATIELIAGWNLVGYPHPTAQVMTGTFGILTNLDMPVETYDSADPYRLRTVDIFTEDHEPGHGYWVHVAADEILTIQCP